MIKYNISTSIPSNNRKISKEKLLKRKESLIKMNNNIKKQVKIIEKKEIMSLEYIKNHYSD